MESANRPLKQKTIGILGGASNVATGYYYEFLNEVANKKLGKWDIAETITIGMNFGNIEYFIRQNDWDSLKNYLEKKVQALKNANVDVVICVSNTLHKLLDDIMPAYDIPFIHIVDPTAEAIHKVGLSKVILFGTKPVMNMDYLRNRYQYQFGIEIIVPTEDEQNDIDAIIFDELVKGIVKEASKQRYVEIAERLAKDEGGEGLILGCTEIFTLVAQSDFDTIKVFNTTRLHCDAAIDYALT